MTQKVGKIYASHKRVREAFHYDPDTGWVTWKIQPKHRKGVIQIGDRAGEDTSLKKNKGRRIYLDRKAYNEHRLIWFWVTGKNASLEIDHKDGNPYNNKWENLRLATGLQNAANTNYKRKNKTGYRGVMKSRSHKPRRGQYFALIIVNRRRRNLGYFATAEEAHEAYKFAAKKLRGEFYREPSPIEM